ncbi:virulence factor [Candidatus Obscuribacterales bacterium]|nr:virulence factor [Candidatus Obscuribacterales bacterium]
MQLKSVETTPNPNSMKLNLSETLEVTKTYSAEDNANCPPFIIELLAITGVKSVFACNDFVTVTRDPRSDWKTILEQATQLFEAGTTSPEVPASGIREAFEKEGQVHVLVQTFRGVPIQVKAVTTDGESRISLGDRFNEVALAIQDETGADFLKERYWADHGVRYGNRDEVANEVAEELRGLFTTESLDQAKQSATSGAEQPEIATETLVAWLDDEDWRRRLAAVQEIKASEETVPLLARALQDENQQVRRLAAAALGTTGSIDAIPVLCTAVLTDPHVGVRRTAGDALSDIGDPLAEPAMCEALQDANKLVRWRAARFLFDVGTNEALPFLERAINDREFEVRLEVEAAIERIREGLQGIGPAWKRIVENR